MHHPTDRITHTPVVEHWLEREIAQWVHSMKDRSIMNTDAQQSQIITQFVDSTLLAFTPTKFRLCPAHGI